MRNFMSKTFLSALLFLLAAFPALAEVMPIDITKLAATQSEVGREAVTKMMVFWAEQGGSPEGFQKYLATKIVGKPFPGVSGPSLWGQGEMTYILDGHHRASAYNRILTDDYDKLPDGIKKVLSRDAQAALRADPNMRFRIDVQKNYATADELVKDFALSGRGQLPPSVRNNPEFQKAFENLRRGQTPNMAALRTGYSSMAGSLSSLKDSPLRSAVGNAFFKAGVDSDRMIHYIEFHVAERIEGTLKARGIVVTSANSVTPEIEREVQRAIFDDKAVMKYLRDNPRGAGQATLNIEMMNKAEAKFHADRLNFPRTLPANCGAAFSLLAP